MASTSAPAGGGAAARGGGTAPPRLSARRYAALRRSIAACRRGVPYQPGGWRGEGTVASKAAPASGTAAGGGAPRRPKPSRVSTGGSAASASAPWMPADSATIRRSICTNSPDSGRFDHSAVAVTWNSTMRPRPARFRGDQRRAVGEARPAPLGQARRGLGQHLPLHRHLLRHGQAGEGRAGREGREALRLLPGQRAAELPLGAERHRQQRVGPLGDARAGEADQRAAGVDPGGERLPLRPFRQPAGRPAPAPRSGATAGVRASRAASRHRARGRGRGRTGRRSAACPRFPPRRAAGRRGGGGSARRAAARRRRRARPPAPAGPPGCGSRSAAPAPPRPMPRPPGAARPRGRAPGRRRCAPAPRLRRRRRAAPAAPASAAGRPRRPAAAGGAPAARSARRVSGPAAASADCSAPDGGALRRVLHAVRHRQGGRGAGVGGAPCLEGGERGGVVRRPGLRPQRREPGAEIAGRHRADHPRRFPGLARRGGEQGGGAAFPPGAVERGGGGGHARGPVRRGGPAVVHHEQQRPFAADAGARPQHRPGEAEDQQRRGHDAEQQQPPGRAGRRFLGDGQVVQQPHGREGDPARGRRGDAEQPPQHRQGRQGDEQPGGREGEGTQTQHRMPGIWSAPIVAPAPATTPAALVPAVDRCGASRNPSLPRRRSPQHRRDAARSRSS